MSGRRLVVVEALTSGAGLDVLDAAVRSGVATTFVTRDPARYYTDPKRDLMISDEIDLRVTDTLAVPTMVELLTSLADESLVLVAPNEIFLPTLWAAADAAGIPFVSQRTMTLSQDKRAFRTAVAAAGIAQPRSVAVSTPDEARRVAEDFGYPVVLKPSVGTGSYGVMCVMDEGSLEECWAETLHEAEATSSTVLVEELSVGPLVSAEIVVAQGTTHLLGITDRTMSGLPRFRELMMRFPAILRPADEITVHEMCRTMVETLDFGPGAAHVEFVLSQSGPQVIEFNARMGGGNLSRMMSYALGFPVYDAVIAAHLGELVTLGPPTAGAAEASLFASRGRFEGLGGEEVARRVPGFQETIVTMPVGTVVGEVRDQRGECATLWCGGVTAEEAGLRAGSAASCVVVRTTPCEPP